MSASAEPLCPISRHKPGHSVHTDSTSVITLRLTRSRRPLYHPGGPRLRAVPIGAVPPRRAQGVYSGVGRVPHTEYLRTCKVPVDLPDSNMYEFRI